MSSSISLSERVRRFVKETVIPTVILLVVIVAGYFGLGLAVQNSTPVRLVQIDMSPWYVTSMYPALMAGDVILVEGVRAEDVRVGDVIIFSRSYSANPIIHRVIQIVQLSDGRLAFRTKGDYNTVPDTPLVDEGDLLGRWSGLKVQLIGLPVIAVMEPLGRYVTIALIVALSLYSILFPESEVAEGSQDGSAASQGDGTLI
jgi:signal peptidase